MGLYQPSEHPNEVLAFRDAFGRLRISEPRTLFDSKLLVSDYPTLFWDEQQTSGAGTSSAYSSADARVRMSVSASTAGVRIRQSFRRFNYQPGKSQTSFMTFNMNGGATGVNKRLGLFDGSNGIYFQMAGTTPEFVIRKAGFDRRYPQALWNQDRLDGLGYSGVLLDVTKVQIFYFDFEWLGVGSVRLGFVINGKIVVAHIIDHANAAESVYISTPNLPLRYEISNSGTGAATSMDCICSTINSEGGVEDNGVERSIDRGSTGLTTGNDANLYPLLGIRLKSTHLAATVRPVSFSILCTSTANYRHAVCFNPTLAGAAVVWVPLANSSIEYSLPTNTSTWPPGQAHLPFMGSPPRLMTRASGSSRLRRTTMPT